jgi:hypothetical protein
LSPQQHLLNPSNTIYSPSQYYHQLAGYSTLDHTNFGPSSSSHPAAIDTFQPGFSTIDHSTFGQSSSSHPTVGTTQDG